MPQVANIVSEKYYNQFSNGADFGSNLTDFSANLTGGVGEKIKAVIRLSVEWYSNSDSFNTWLVEANQITRFSGSFKDDGFEVGHVFRYISGWSTDRTAPVEFTATITAISTDGATITFTVSSGVVPTGTQDDAGIRADATASANYLTAAFWRFGLVANDASFSNQSNVSGNNAAFFAGGVGIDSGSGRSTTPVAMSPQGTYRDWLSGNATVAFISNTDYEQVFEIAHEFVITPFYLEGQLSNLQNTVLPDYLQGENTLKYTYQSEFRLSLSNPNTAITATFDQNLGSVGWFGENFNGLGCDYEVTAIAYEDALTAEPVQSLQIPSKTTATITVSKNSASISAGQKVGIILFYLAPETDYQNTLTTLVENFMLESLYCNEGAAPVSGTIITAMSSVISGGDLVVTADIQLDAIQQARAVGGNYALCIQIADSALSAQNSDRAIILADVEQFLSVSVIDELVAFDAPNFYYHDFDYPTDTPVTELLAWNEDGTLIEWDFELDLSKSAFLNRLTFVLAAVKTADSSYFELDRYVFETASAIVSGGVQQINIDAQRGYYLVAGDQFNFAKLQTGALAGSMQSYKLLIGQKVKWQDWILNAGADTVFFDSSKPNNNLNFKASNYALGVEGYEIKCMLIASVSGVDELSNAVAGDAVAQSNALLVYDYDQDGSAPALWTGTIRTFDPATMADLGGNILSDRDTLFEIEWENATPVYSAAVIFAIHRIEVFNDVGSQIQELSNLRPYPAGSILKPLSGETQLQVTASGGKLYSRCLIDFTKLTASKYNLSGRLQR